MSMVKVMVVDDQLVARGYFENSIDTSPRYEVVASFGSADAAVVFCAGNPVDLVIMDVVMKHGLDGLQAAEAIKKENPQIKIVVATSMPDATFVQRARAAGVESFWYKEYSDCSLIEVMDATMAGQSVYPDALPPIKLGQALNTDLTAQELAVLREMATGASNAEIAERLCVSVHTVRTHVKHLLAKTGFDTRTQLAVNASLAGVVVLTSHD